MYVTALHLIGVRLKGGMNEILCLPYSKADSLDLDGFGVFFVLALGYWWVVPMSRPPRAVERPAASTRLDIMEWLKNQEEFILWNTDGLLRSEEYTGEPNRKIIKEWEEELQIIRDLKQIVTKSYRWDEEET